MSQLDDFVNQYYKGLADSVYGTPIPLSSDDTALVIIDAQTSISQEYYTEAFKGFGMDVETIKPLLDEIGRNLKATLDNIEMVLAACRAKGILPIHVKIQAYLPDASDTGRLHKSAGMLYPPGAPGTDFLPEAAPDEGEIVLTKSCSGIHVGTPIDRILRNLDIKRVLIAGFYTDQCVSTSVRDLSDLGYQVSIIEDAINAMSEERHEKALLGIKKIYANSETTESVVSRLNAL
ncbi:MAG: cysteine hydrolase [Desulfohalobiaceae bacterium]|nr:cysteine hydrolase [Desulfohalobiaceae bacterium]